MTTTRWLRLLAVAIFIGSAIVLDGRPLIAQFAAIVMLLVILVWIGELEQ